MPVPAVDPVTAAISAGIEVGTTAYGMYQQNEQRKKDKKSNAKIAALIDVQIREGGTIDQAIQEATRFTEAKTAWGEQAIGRSTGLELRDTGYKMQALEARSGFAGSGALDRLQGNTVDDILTGAVERMYEMRMTEQERLMSQLGALESTRMSLTTQRAGLGVGSLEYAAGKGHKWAYDALQYASAYDPTGWASGAAGRVQSSHNADPKNSRGQVSGSPATGGIYVPPDLW
jgi:hypothetical protein